MLCKKAALHKYVSKIKSALTNISDCQGNFVLDDFQEGNGKSFVSSIIISSDLQLTTDGANKSRHAKHITQINAHKSCELIKHKTIWHNYLADFGTFDV